MLDNIYVVNENGQIQINFDSLELVTSKEFVGEILDFVAGNVNHIRKFSITKNQYCITVMVLDVADRIASFRFYPSYSVGTKIYTNVMWLSDLEDLGVYCNA